MNTLIKQNADVETFVSMILTVRNGLVAAGQFLAKKLAQCPTFIDEIVDAHPEFTEESLKRLASVGRGELHPTLVFADGPGPRRLRRLPFSIQDECLTNKLELLLENGESLKIDVMDLQAMQAAQVIGDDTIRSLASQRAWLEEQKAKQSAPPVRANLPYRVVKDELVVMEKCKIPFRDILLALPKSQLVRLIAEVR